MLSKGTVITCEDCGKGIATVGKYMKVGEKLKRDHLEKFRIEEPKKDDDIARVKCPECGGAWVKHPFGDEKSLMVHTDAHGWQPGEDEDLK